MRLAVVNTKGGTSKTTSAVYLAAGLHRRGRTLLVDADPQGSALLWSQQGEGLPFTTVSLPVRDLPRRMGDLGQDYAFVVVDTPPGDLGIIRPAIMAVDLAIVPVSPTGLDLNRVRPTFELLAELETLNPVNVGVLLTKVRRRTRSAAVIRTVLEERGYPVLDAEIPLAEAYASSFGTAPTDLAHYGAVLDELLVVAVPA